ncbi:MAG TPA: hypothetical protein VJQ54_15935 [Candidatus Sulfotelmatobacter sp.]|nr:hypothetical protein [Candidatus Sulfotelmatobacter sp.]
MNNSEVTPESLSRTVADFLSEASAAIVLEDGATTFDLAEAKYSISGEYNKCLLHLWSAERNTVRRVLDAEVKGGTLRLAVQRLGQTLPSKLEICRERDRRSASAKRAARTAYEQRLRRAIERHFPGFQLARLTSAIDLEKSFGPIYARGLLRRGQSAFAVMGVNASETQASIDAALTFAILWLDVCRENPHLHHHHGNRAEKRDVLVEGLLLFVPHSSSALLRERMANLNREAAKWRLFEFDEREASLVEIDCSDRGNVATRLVHAINEAAVFERFAESIARVKQILPNCEVAVLSPAELGFRWRGLEFARARMGAEAITFQSKQEIVFGVGPEERALEDRNWPLFVQLLTALRDARHPYGLRQGRLFRMHPERWLESLVSTDVSVIDERLETESVYSQVPAFSAADRAMIDILTLTREERLAVVELKADEDIHLPLQGLDYWSRVRWHHERGEFLKFGYFGGRELSPESPLLYLVAPSLHVHPTTDKILRYISRDIEWAFVGIDERWREGVRVVFRKRSKPGGPDSCREFNDWTGLLTSS